MWVPLSLGGGGGNAESGGARAGGHKSSRVRRGRQHLRPRPRRKMGTPRRPRGRTERRDCSRTATAAWAAASGGDSPPSPAPSGPSGSDPPPSGTTRAASGASQNTPGFLEQTRWGSVSRKAEGGEKPWDPHPHPDASGTCQPGAHPRPWAASGSPCLHRAWLQPPWLQSSLEKVPWEGLKGCVMCTGNKTGAKNEAGSRCGTCWGSSIRQDEVLS